MAQRICDVTGCGKKHLAKGMCKTHYNRSLGKSARHRRYTVQCTVCGVSIQRHHRPDRRPVCSVTCRRWLTCGTVGPQVDGWAQWARNRAARFGVVLEDVERDLVLDRDGWLCYLCGVRVQLDDVFASDAATVDHVIPLSAGGSHTYNNVRCACLGCNSGKGARLEAV